MGIIKTKTASIASALLGVGLLVSNIANAAVVEIISPDNPGPVYQIDTPDGTIVDPAGNGDVEFILLGVHETLLHPSNASENGCSGATCNDEITVNLNNAVANRQTKGVSLLLSAAESLVWNLNVNDAAIDLLSVYVFGAESQTININGSSIGEILSPESVCAFSYPAAASGCSTDRLLGISSASNPGGFTNLLADEQFLNDQPEYQVTSFNGTYFADGFNVTIESAVIPVPAAWLMFASALAALGLRKQLR